jgi:hypothetical protein
MASGTTDETPSLPGYEVDAPLGHGGYGAVWAARRSADGREVALKIGHVGHGVAVARFRREADALARVGPPHVPALLGAGELADGRPFLVLERLSGVTLEDRLSERTTPLALTEISELVAGLATCLEAVHAHGIVHRDLKPANIFLRGDGTVAVMDFGLARAAHLDEERLTETGQIVGTLHYMSPEQIAGAEEVDQRSDIYSLGVILYRLLTGTVPFDLGDHTVEHGHLALRPPLPSTRAAVPAAIEAVVLACLAKRVNERPASAQALAGRWADAVGDGARAAAPPLPTPTPEGHEARAAAASPARALGGGAEPVLLVVAWTTASAEAVAELVRRHRGAIARHRGDEYVCALAGAKVDDPFEVGLALAAALCEERAARAVLHLADLVVRWRGRGGLALYGRELDEPKSWRPDGDFSGVLASPALAALLGERLGALAPRADGFVPVALTEAFAHETAPTDDSPLLERDDALVRLRAGAAASLDGGAPCLTTILGDHGLGKSRLLETCAALARERADCRILSLSCRRGAEVSAADRLRAWLEVDATPTLRRADLVRVLGDRLRAWGRTGPVAIFVDDTHRADDVALDALEYATLGGDTVRLWVVTAALGLLEESRSSWGARADRHDRIALTVLGPDAAAELVAYKLRPAEYPPRATLARLAAWAGGNPRHIIEAVTALKRQGVVRRQPGAAGWTVATAVIEALPASPADQWLAARTLDELPPELAALVRLGAVLGPDLTRAEVAGVQDALERSGGPSSAMDAGVGLERLALAGILDRTGDGSYQFRSEALRSAVYELSAPTSRRQLHACALVAWRGRGDSGVVLAQRARHAAACGQNAEAAGAYLALGESALQCCDAIAADGHYTQAIACAADHPVRQAVSLLGRGRARTRLDRLPEALVDFDAALVAADQLGDRELAIAIRFAQAIAHDWHDDFAAATACVQSAGELLAATGEPERDPRYLVGVARARCRQHDWHGAIPLLRRALLSLHDSSGETPIIARMLLAPALVLEGQLDEAEAGFVELIDLCEQSSDRFHQAAAHGNRLRLWQTRRVPDRALEDLRRAVQIAREIGHPNIEAQSTFNLAELTFWNGDHGEALRLARRAYDLQARFRKTTAAVEALLLARIHAARDELDEARRALALLRAAGVTDLAPTESLLVQALELFLGNTDPAVPTAPPDAWATLIAQAERQLPPEERREIQSWRARAAQATSDTQ